MESKEEIRLIRFIKEELSVPSSSLDLALRRCQSSVTTLPIVLWQYGFIDFLQLERILDWAETPRSNWEY